MRSLAVVLLACLPLPLLAQDHGAMLTLPMFSQTVTLGYPFGDADIAPDYTETTHGGDASISEWVPAGQDINRWRQMLTIIAQRDAATVGDTAALLEDQEQRLHARYVAGCATPPELTRLPSTTPDGARAAIATLLVCGRVMATNFGEAMVALSVVGRSDIYSIQWAERFPAEGKETPVAATWAERVAHLAAARLD